MQESLLVGLGPSFAISLLLYVVGYAIISWSTSIGEYAGGTLLNALGNAAMVSLQSVTIFSYWSSLGDNALLNSLLSVPYYVTGWLAPFIASGILKVSSWRWGVRMFCILTPIMSLLLVITLSVSKPQDASSKSISAKATVKSRARRVRGAFTRDGHLDKLDLVGLLLLAVALGLLLIPLTLAGQGSMGWTSPVVLGMVGGGAIALAAFAVYETCLAKYPIFPRKAFKERRTVVTVIVTFINFVSFCETGFS
ncbi:hypothetical protein RQP46_008661 [Phenoliferia psychrophenolica]